MYIPTSNAGSSNNTTDGVSGTGDELRFMFELVSCSTKAVVSVQPPVQVEQCSMAVYVPEIEYRTRIP